MPIYDPGVLVRALTGIASWFGVTVPRNFELAHLPALHVPAVHTPMVLYETAIPDICLCVHITINDSLKL